MRGSLLRAVASISKKGQRNVQEDHLLADEERGLFVLADGFGGAIPGAEVSKLACHAVFEFLDHEAGDKDATLPFELRRYYTLNGNVLFNAIIHANQKVFRRNDDRGIYEKGGTSLIAGYFDGDLLTLANVGSSSAWVLRSGQEPYELARPRSYSRHLNAFESTPRNAMDIPLMALGTSEGLEPEIYEYRVQKGDWLVFQTDGVSKQIIEKISEMQNSGMPAEQARGELEQICDQAGLVDNHSISLAIT